ncbi:MAG: hypothetical protein UU98_C0005G0001 [Parcubacteria group bacterium GW2011_GWD2_42_14]|nr:MAG: hypothetical protein UU98_C0005G0001 [Parcubacteria group bacterium GW2011_GWD2_42_14]
MCTLPSSIDTCSYIWLSIFRFKYFQNLFSQKTEKQENTAMKEITPEEKEQFFAFWNIQRQAIKGRVSVETMYWFNAFTAKDNIGYEFGQLRPGKLGQWDLYQNLTGDQSAINCDENEALVASGLNIAEIAEENRREYYRGISACPDDKLEIAMFNRFQHMSPEQFDAEIDRLEQQLIE